MVEVHVQLFLVAFRLESGTPAFVTLVDEHGDVPHRLVQSDAHDSATRVLDDVWERIGLDSFANASPQAKQTWDALRPSVRLAGADWSPDGASLAFTAPLKSPLAETELDVTAGTPFTWRTLNESAGRRGGRDLPDVRNGLDAIVLDHWRQALEETDVALDVLPPYLTLLQLRAVYDAVWGYDQDPSGFKRWAVDRPGAFQALLEEAPNDALDGEFFRSLAQVLPAEAAAEAGALTRSPVRQASFNELGPAIGLASALSANRLFRRPGPEPTWYTHSEAWRAGPSWIENLYPPRPAWTRWNVGV